MSRLFDIAKFLLSGSLVIGGSLALIATLPYRAPASRLPVRRLISAGGGLLLLSAFLYWIWPTPWRNWEKDDEYYRTHLFTGEKQQLMECGCDWFTINE